MIPRVKPEGMLFGKPLHTFPDHALVQRQFGQRSTVNREGLAQTGSERAVASPKMLVFDLFRAIGRQPSEHLAVGRRSVIALKSFLPSVCNGRTHSGPLGGLCFLCAAARGALTSLRAKFGIFAAKPHTLRKVYAATPSGTLRQSWHAKTSRPDAAGNSVSTGADVAGKAGQIVFGDVARDVPRRPRFRRRGVPPWQFFASCSIPGRQAARIFALLEVVRLHSYHPGRHCGGLKDRRADTQPRWHFDSEAIRWDR